MTKDFRINLVHFESLFLILNWQELNKCYNNAHKYQTPSFRLLKTNSFRYNASFFNPFFVSIKTLSLQ